MRDFTVYFELYGKKMKKKIIAKSGEAAKDVIKNSIKFHKVTVDKSDEFNQAMDMMDDLLGMLKKNDAKKHN